MREWLEKNPGGQKEAFKRYFNTLTQVEKKVCNHYDIDDFIIVLITHFMR